MNTYQVAKLKMNTIVHTVVGFFALLKLAPLALDLMVGAKKYHLEKA